MVAFIGLAIAIVGYWAPWVDHFTAALVIPGFDLAEYVKFLPEVRAGTVPVIRELFYLPAPVAGLCLGLIVGRRRRGLPAWCAILLAIIAACLALVVAPPPDFIIRFPQDGGLRAEWGRQAALSAAGFLAVAAALIWARHLRRWIAVLLNSLSAIIGTAIPLWQFFALRPAIDRVYHKPVVLGWGLWLMPAGFALFVGAVWWSAFSSGEGS